MRGAGGWLKIMAQSKCKRHRGKCDEPGHSMRTCVQMKAVSAARLTRNTCLSGEGRVRWRRKMRDRSHLRVSGCDSGAQHRQPRQVPCALCGQRQNLAGPPGRPPAGPPPAGLGADGLCIGLCDPRAVSMMIGRAAAPSVDSVSVDEAIEHVQKRQTALQIRNAVWHNVSGG